MKADLRFLFMTRKHNKIREQRIAGPQAKRSQMSSRELDTQNINGNASSGSSSKIIQAEKHLREALVSELINSRGNLNSPRMDLEDCQLFGSLTQTQPLSVEFPKAFNPRKEANMSHKEKVGQWIMTVPIYPSTMEEVWFNGCYSSLDPLTDQTVDLLGESYDFSNFKDVIQFQSQMITLLTNKLYWIEPEPPKNPNTDANDPAFLYEYNGSKIHVADHFVCQQPAIRIPLNDSNYIN